MKKLIALLLVLTLSFALIACGKKPAANDPVDDPIVEVVPEEELEKEEIENDKNVSETPEKPEVKPEADKKPEAKPEADKKPAAKPEETTKPEAKPEVKPEVKPEAKPEEKPEVKPEETPQASTLGNTLLADFKAKAASASSALALAEALSANSAIQEMGMFGSMEVEPGYLTGFDNAEITGFKSGAVFMPMIGTHPFIGYVFELEDGADTSAFISNLKSNANLRWNICTSADEMVSGSVGNKVFFIMCPTSLEQ